jgi:hypothetical protein
MSKAQPILQEVPRRVVRPAQQSMLKLAQYTRNPFTIDVDDEVTLQDLQDPAFWSNLADLGMNDTIEIRQSTRWSLGVVGDVSTGYVRVDIVQTMERAPRADGDEMRQVPPGHVIRRRRSDDPVGTPEFAVVRKATDKLDEIVMNTNTRHSTHEQALRWLLDHSTIRGEATVRYV